MTVKSAGMTVNRGGGAARISAASATLWIPAFAGMTVKSAGMTVNNQRRRGEHPPASATLWIPAFARITGANRSGDALSFLTPLSSLLSPLIPHSSLFSLHPRRFSFYIGA